jgi:hypothetical protein
MRVRIDNRAHAGPGETAARGSRGDNLPRLGRFGGYDPRERHAVIRAQSHAILHTATVPYIVFERPALWLQSSYRMQGLPVLDTNLYPRLSCPGPGMNATTLSS